LAPALADQRFARAGANLPDNLMRYPDADEIRPVDA